MWAGSDVVATRTWCLQTIRTSGFVVRHPIISHRVVVRAVCCFSGSRSRVLGLGLFTLLTLAACTAELGGTLDVNRDGDLPGAPDEHDSGSEPASPDAAFNIHDEDSSCGNADADTQEHRVAFAAASVTSPSACMSETQTRTCDDGQWSAWSGTFSFQLCTVFYRSCGDLAHGASESRVRYPVAVVDDYEACAPEQQTRTCNDGTLSEWSGTASQTSCEVISELYGVCGNGSVCHEGQCANSHTMFFTSQCLSPDGGNCASDDQCVNTFVKGTCAPKADAGKAADGANDCNFLACLTAPGSATCTDQLCQCQSGSYCTSNDQCVGTCAGSSCRAINTVCDTGDAASHGSLHVRVQALRLAPGQCLRD